MSNFYITTTLPYANSTPHIGHATEFIQADSRARFERLQGRKVFFNVGTDEHGTKISQAAEKEGLAPKEFIDIQVKKFEELLSVLNCSPDRFIRTTQEEHKSSAREFWKRCLKNGDIYKNKHEGIYCVGCELYKTESDLVDGRCPIHKNMELEKISEENYFFKFSKYQKALQEHYEKNKDFVVPNIRLKEINSFVSAGLKDFSISRDKNRLKWGVSIPDDDTQTMYVWFDALTNYISTLGWPDNDKWSDWWPPVQVAGKDNLRQQAAIWQAMLLSAGIPLSKQIFIHGFSTLNGQKMSKTSGNTIDPMTLIEHYGTDFLRLFVLKHIHPFEDTDLSEEMIHNAYNADLVNGLGNLTSRVLTMSSKHIDAPQDITPPTQPKEYTDAFVSFNTRRVCEIIWEKIHNLDLHITQNKPFSLIKTEPDKAKEFIKKEIIDLYEIAHLLTPIIPDTSSQIIESIKANTAPKHLFPHKEKIELISK